MTHVSSQRPTVLSPLLYNSLEGLKMLRSPEMVAKLRGKTVEEILG